MAGLAIDEYFTRTDAGGARGLLTDALGSTLALTDGSGTVQTEYSYEPFGATAVTGASTTSALAFTAREADETGLYYYRARFYNPGTLRFISEDPIGFGGGLNLFAYVQNGPTSFVDPFGLSRRPAFQGGGPHIGPPQGPHIGPPPGPHMGPVAAAAGGAGSRAGRGAGSTSGANSARQSRPRSTSPQTFEQMVHDAGQRARAMADPWTYGEIGFVSVLGGTVGAGAANGGALAGDVVEYLTTNPVDVNGFVNEVINATGPVPTPPTNWPTTIGNVINVVLQHYGIVF